MNHVHVDLERNLKNVVNNLNLKIINKTQKNEKEFQNQWFHIRNEQS